MIEELKMRNNLLKTEKAVPKTEGNELLFLCILHSILTEAFI